MKCGPLFALIALLVTLSGCGKGNFSQQQSGKTQNVLRYPIASLTKLDPATVQDGDSIDVLQQVFEGLVEWGEDNKVRPNLAEKWVVSPDGRTYTFTLKKGVKFQNGREMTAGDFKYSLERVTNPDFNSPTAPTYLNALDGFPEKWAKKAQELRGVKVVDPYTLQITIDRPRPYFLGLLTYPAAFVVCKEALDAGKEITQVSQMVGTGPFKADRFLPGQIITLAAFKDYHEGAPKIDGIERPVIADPVTRLNKFKAGEFDLTRIERIDVQALQSDPKYKDQIHWFDRPAVYYLALNVKTYKPFANRLVRRAIAMALDKDHIVTQTLNGTVKLANGILPPSVLGSRDLPPAIPYNVQEAQKLLAQAGYPGGKGLPQLTLSHRDGQADVKVVAEELVTEFRKNLGIEAQTKMIPWGTYLAENDKNELDFYHMRWSADYLDPQNFLSTLLASYGNENHNNYSNPFFDSLCSKGDVMVGNEAARLKLYANAEDIALQDAAFIPIYFEKDAELISPRVKGLRESIFGHLPHTTTTLQ